MPRRRRGTSKLLAVSMAYLRGIVNSLNIDEKLVLAELITFQCSIINVATNHGMLGLSQHGISTRSTSSQRSTNSVQFSDHSTTQSSTQSSQTSAQSMSVERARPSPVSALKVSVLNSVMDCLQIAEQGGIPIAELNTLIQDVVQTLVRLEASITSSTPNQLASVEPMASLSTDQPIASLSMVHPIPTPIAVQLPSTSASAVQTSSNQLATVQPMTLSTVQSISTAVQVQSTSANASNSILVTPVQTASNQLASVQPISSLSAVSTVAELPSTSRSEKVTLWLRELPTANLEQC